MPSKRVLITGLSTYWGGRLALALEGDPSIEAIVGVDNEEPSVELDRTEYVKVGAQHALLRRIVEAAEIDTVVDTRLVVDSSTTSSRNAHENNVIGTMNILAACSGTSCCVRKFIFKSSTHFYGSEQDDPAFFDETMGRPHAPRTPIERDILEAESSVAEFADKNPGVTVTILRFANVLGPDVRTSHIDLFSLPAVPMILGFDPRYQFVHEDDVVHGLEHVVQRQLPGVFNLAADGVLTLTEVAGLLGKPYAPILPPWGTGLAAGLAGRLGVKIPAEMLNQLRFGRGVDNRRLKACGFEYGYTSREAVLKLGEHLRLHPLLRSSAEPYRYEREVEEFLRWSPNVRSSRLEDSGGLTREQLVELQRLLSAYDPPKDPGVAIGAACRDDGHEERDGRSDGVRESEPEPQPQSKPRRPSPPLAEVPPPSPPVDHYDDLGSEEIISLLGSLDGEALTALREHERAHRGRESVIGAIDSVLARQAAAGH
ncbi:MAG TPA: NAD-dependent epimerase/dehydratase family protein [Thermoleophilaceae bacterium]|nr:NAD-dependent epimerase/dehydratase family protein [Thermoleophilaceae bacterium]